ncbi:MAG: hypothetical protein KAJ62_11475, partial [Desulfobacteraceae bacterium]|nr:hypothetical protein [Desulfobacteraceae bacterium]
MKLLCLKLIPKLLIPKSSFMKKFVLILFFVFIGSFINSSVYSTTLKIATISPEGSMWMEKMR